MNDIERGPKMNIEDTRGRFMDYIGNPLSGILGPLDLLQDQEFKHPNKSEYPDKIKKMWSELFRRLEVFKNGGFEPTGNITVENIQKLLGYKDRDPIDGNTVDEFKKIYNDMVGKTKIIDEINKLKR